MRTRLRLMWGKRRKTLFVGIAVVLLSGGVFFWGWLSVPRESSVRLMYKLRLEELQVAVNSFQKSYNRIPNSLEELKLAGNIENISDFEVFKYLGGTDGIIAVQKEPVRGVKKGEPWGGNGEVARDDIPAARLMLFTDGSIKLVNAADFERRYTDFGVESKLVELIPGMRWSKWYEEKSGYRPDIENFGAYVMLSVGDELYIGFGTGRPTQGDGALIARFDSKTLEPIGSLAEEGIHEMIWDPQREILHIAGTDPSWPDDWSAGNHYTYTPLGREKIIKHRDSSTGLINVIHTWGLWMSRDHVLYAAVSSHDGSFVKDTNVLRKIFNRINWMLDASYYSRDYGLTRRGQIFKSQDDGTSWSYVSDLGYFRAYDVIGFNDKLYAIYTDTPESPCKLAVNENGDKKWSDVTQHSIDTVHLVEFQNKLLAVSSVRDQLYAVSEDKVEKYMLPQGFRIRSAFNVLAVGDQYIYAIFTDWNGKYFVVRSHNLRDWELVTSTDRRLVSIAYWPERKWVVVSDAGIYGGVWKIDVGVNESGDSARGPI